MRPIYINKQHAATLHNKYATSAKQNQKNRYDTCCVKLSSNRTRVHKRAMTWVGLFSASLIPILILFYEISCWFFRILEPFRRFLNHFFIFFYFYFSWLFFLLFISLSFFVFISKFQFIFKKILMCFIIVHNFPTLFVFYNLFRSVKKCSCFQNLFRFSNLIGSFKNVYVFKKSHFPNCSRFQKLFVNFQNHVPVFKKCYV